jgi:hypothetical protein
MEKENAWVLEKISGILSEEEDREARKILEELEKEWGHFQKALT